MRIARALQALCTSLALLLAAVMPGSSATRHVVLLFDERPELPGLAILEADLVRTLTANSADRVEIYREAMDLSRFGSATYQPILRDFLRTKYAGKKVDVVVGILGPALEFLLEHGNVIFPGTPVVFCGIDRRELGERTLPPHVRGVLVKREFAPTLSLALSFHPTAQRAVIVGGTSEFDKHLLEQAKGEFREFENRLSFTYLTTLSLQQLMAELSQLPPQTLVLFITLFRDGAGEPFVPHNVVQRVSNAANAPLYGFVDQYLGLGIVGGSLYSLSTHGIKAGKLVLQVLAGVAPPGPSLLQAESHKLLFDWRQLQRWGISASKLPSHSEIRFRDSTAWDQFREQVLAALTLVFAEGILIVWLFYEYRRRRRSEAAALALSGHLITAQEEERSRLARELHDDVSQRLASLAIDAGLEEKRLPAPAGGATIRRIREDLIRLGQDVHALSYRLHPSILHDLGLTQALKAECEGFAQRHSLEVNVRVDQIPEDVSRDVGLCLFRIAQESLHNIARHASAGQVEVRLRHFNGGLELTVRDDGVGFNLAREPIKPSLGLGSMRQRLALVGGKHTQHLEH